jgi:hypothetical protein
MTKPKSLFDILSSIEPIPEEEWRLKVLRAATLAASLELDPVDVLKKAAAEKLKELFRKPPGRPPKDNEKGQATAATAQFTALIENAPPKARDTIRLDLVRSLASPESIPPNHPVVGASRALLAVYGRHLTARERRDGVDVGEKDPLTLAGIRKRVVTWIPWALPLLKKKD